MSYGAILGDIVAVWIVFFAAAWATQPGSALHAQARPMKKSPGGVRSFGVGLRVGYWPCLCAPYVQITVLFWRLDVWFGLPSYTHEGGV